ncbi:MAG: hypothetical protein WAS93_07780 [Burkholderiaceae bacterium]
MAQLSNLIHCKVRVVTGLCKVYEYEQDSLSTMHALEDALERFGDQECRIFIKADGVSLFRHPRVQVS